MSVDATTPAVAGQVAATDAAAISKDAPAAEPASVSTESAVTAAEPATDATTAADAAPASTEEKVNDKEIKVTAAPVTSGTLGYKAPGLINQIRFKKHFFWLGEEAAVPVSELESYRRGEKADVANPTVAWSSQTGKGLLYFTKNSELKEKPTGIINLAEVTDIAKEGDKDFSLQLNKHKHHFQASNADERNGWLVALDKESTAAKEAKETVTGSEGYKTTLASLDKPASSAAAPAAAAAATGAAAAGAAAAVTKDDKEDKADKPEERHVSDDEDKLGAKEKKAKSKSRSVSRSKRQSIFGGLLGKKDEAKKEEAAPDAFADDPVKAEGAAGVVEPAAPAEPVAAFADDPVKAEAPEAAAAAALATAKPTPSPKGSTKKDNSAKRQSIFGGLFQKSAAPEKKEAEAPEKKEAEATKEDEATAEDKTKEPEAESAAPAAAAAVAAGAGAAGVVAATQEPEKKDEEKKEEEKETPAAAPKEERRRSSFFGLGSKKAAKPAEKKEEEAKPAEETESAPVTTAPAVAAAAAAAPAAAADTEVITNGEVKDEQKTAEKEKKTSKLGDLFRRPSKLAKEAKAKKAAEKEAPATVAEETPAAETTAATTIVEPLAPTATDKITENGPAAGTAEASIGDVVPEAVTVGEGPKVVAANA